MNYSLGEIARAMNADLIGKEEAIVEKVFTDSRNEIDFKNRLYIALNGPRHNGHDFIPELIEKGCRLFLIDNSFDYLPFITEASFILCKDTKKTLQTLAIHHRNAFKGKVIGITGSNGKTIVKDWLGQIVSLKKKTCISPRSYNSQIGVPLSVLNLNHDDEIGIFEAGISMPDEMEKLEGIIQPEIGILTNLGTAHDEGFNSSEEKIKEKVKLFRRCNSIIFCRDSEIVRNTIQKEFSGVNLFDWSFTGNDASILADAIQEGNSTRIHLSGKINLEYVIPFIDKASIENSINVACAALLCEVDEKLIVSGMLNLQSVNMRLEIKRGINSCLIINESYSLDLTSLSLALDYLAKSPGYQKRTLILSDLPNAQEGEKSYEDLGNILREKKVNRVIAIGPELNKHRKFLLPDTQYFPDTNSFIENIHSISFENEKILIKGARLFFFEQIENLLQEKRHQTTLEINLNSIIHNVNYFRSLLKPGVRTMAMVKASSYGSGDIEVAKELEYHKIDYLAVAYTDEGVRLRKKGIRTPILVMNPEEEGFADLLYYKLEPEIYSFSILKKFSEFLRKQNQSEFFVHLKIDSGMRRLGFEEEEISNLISTLKDCYNLIVRSVFSHLVGSDDAAQDSFTLKQIQIFKRVCEKIRETIGYDFIRHICNSGGISRFPEAHFEMVRLGIGMYGLGISDEENKKLEMPLRFKTRISQIHNVRAGETVGYNQKGKIIIDAKIATIPVGYADGIRRSLGNGNFSFILNNKPVSTCGNICMDMTMINVGQLVCNEGDEVIIFDNTEALQKMAAAAGTITYEILTGISSRVKRIYVHE